MPNRIRSLLPVEHGITIVKRISVLFAILDGAISKSTQPEIVMAAKHTVKPLKQRLFPFH